MAKEKKDKKEDKRKWKGLKAVTNLLMNGDYQSPASSSGGEYIQSPTDANTIDINSGYGTYTDPISGKVTKLQDYATWLASLPGKAPQDRKSQYNLIEHLIQTDDFQKCLNYIQIRAVSQSAETGKIIHVDLDNDAEENNVYYKEVKQLVANLELDKHISDWVFKSAAFGIKAIIPIKEQGVGITGIYDDEHLHPMYMQGFRWYDKDRKKIQVGYVFQRWQKPQSNKGMKLFLEDDIVIFKRKKSVTKSSVIQDPIKGTKDYQKENFDLWDPKTWVGKTPSTDYGHSIVMVAYEAFVSLAKIRQAVEKARLRSAKAYALVNVPTDGLDPVKAQEHSDGYAKIINQIYNKGADALSTLMHVITIPYNAIKQKVDVTTAEGDPNITGIADLEKAEARFTSSLNLDVSVVAGNAGDQSGGIGGAGLMDATTAESAQMSKDSTATGVNGLEDLARIHLLSKHGVVFTKDNKPYKIRIHTGDTRAEKERLALEEQRNMQMNQVVQRDVMLAEFMEIDFVESMVQANVKYLKTDEIEVRKIYKKKAPPPPGEEGAF